MEGALNSARAAVAPVSVWTSGAAEDVDGVSRFTASGIEAVVVVTVCKS